MKLRSNVIRISIFLLADISGNFGAKLNEIELYAVLTSAQSLYRFLLFPLQSHHY
ncbi:hypothetical protein T11_10738 [Trichinella zimbabwensis]|uniref:Uncharacterized protein n=1 Tax=Trichinella zimbabwensis TaxID=268475 RepID=A0A0V1G8A7_9BILA|nr:hypothetical protein T11_10738 [Trichinella zimbabwensis]